jgi:hypothetical protein
MGALRDRLTDPNIQPAVLRACEDLVDAEVAAKSGLSGLALKGALGVVRAMKPGIISELMRHLLPEFATALDPIYDECVRRAGDTGESAGAVFASRLEADPQGTADALLAVTDRRAERAKNATLKRTYVKLRASARDHVAAAVPAAGRALAPYL